jgi:DNA (cytosine-5)-methyltransferase 1
VSKPRILDLFCGAGGAARGYQQAGFEVIGVDVEPQPNYCGDTFIQADALEVAEALAKHGALFCGPGLKILTFDAIHASPPCQAHTDLQKQSKRTYPELIGPTRELLKATGLPYVIENVEGAPLIDPVKICGASIPGLRVIRHRLFESNFPLQGIPCPDRHPLVFTYDKRKPHYGQLDQDASYVQVTGGGNCSVANKLDAMQINWMTGKEVNEAIPPAYCKHVGDQLMQHLAQQSRQKAAA